MLRPGAAFYSFHILTAVSTVTLSVYTGAADWVPAFRRMESSFHILRDIVALSERR